MSAVLLQRNSGSIAGVSTVTVNVAFPSNTAGGSLLLAVCRGSVGPTSPQATVTSVGITTSGISWTLLGSGQVTGDISTSPGDQKNINLSVYYCENASSISSSTNTQLTVISDYTGFTNVTNSWLEIFEFSGIDTLSSLDDSKVASSPSEAVPFVIQTADLSTGSTDMVFVANFVTGIATPSNPGIGYTGSVADPSTQYLLDQWNLSVAPGSISTAFAITYDTGIGYDMEGFVCVAGAFILAPSASLTESVTDSSEPEPGFESDSAAYALAPSAGLTESVTDSSEPEPGFESDSAAYALASALGLCGVMKPVGNPYITAG